MGTNFYRAINQDPIGARRVWNTADTVDVRNGQAFRDVLIDFKRVSGLSDQKIADEIRVSRASITRWLGGHSLPQVALRKPVLEYIKRELGPSNDVMDPSIHIGKRSAAGMYCWDCDVTLCEGGNDGVHYSRHGWHKTCPQCGAAPVDEGLRSGAAALELGFSGPRKSRPTGVRSCCSFSWAQHPEEVRRLCQEYPDSPIIQDEYERAWTGSQFLDMLHTNVAMEFTDSIGTWFS